MIGSTDAAPRNALLSPCSAQHEVPVKIGFTYGANPGYSLAGTLAANPVAQGFEPQRRGAAGYAISTPPFVGRSLVVDGKHQAEKVDHYSIGRRSSQRAEYARDSAHTSITIERN